MEFEENQEYNPVPTKYYNYRGKRILTLDYKHDLFDYDSINIFAYTINNEKRNPFQQILLAKSSINYDLIFPKMPLFINLKKSELIEYTKVCLFGFLCLENYEIFNDLIKFDGFYECNNKLYLFFDLTENKLNLYDIYSNSCLWFGLIDEIVNHKNICNIKINESVTQLFQENMDLCFLVDDKDYIYDSPIVCFIPQTEQKINYTYIFGQIKENRNEILGPYYYFKDYYTAFKEAGSLITDNKKTGLVRFAIFTGNVKYIENFPNDLIDESEIKKQRLQDEKLDKNIECLTMRITDHDGKWAEKYDSVYLGNVELDDGSFLNKKIFVIKEYEQQLPLSYHFINKNTLKGVKEDYLIF